MEETPEYAARAGGRSHQVLAGARQREIYLGGVTGRRAQVPVDMAKLEAAAAKRMSAAGYAYIAGGAGREDTVAHNRAAFGAWRILPRMLRDVAEQDTSITLFGRRLATPFLLCPIGVLEMAHPEADVAVAKAASGAGVPFIFSSQASRSMEDCAAVMGDAPRWFQLYWNQSDELVESFVARAQVCGCEAIVVTLDTPQLGWRIRDLELAHLPFLQGRGIAQYTSDPVFRGQLAAGAGPATDKPPLNRHTLKVLAQVLRRWPDGALAGLKSGQAMAAVRHFLATFSRPNLTWRDLAFLRERTRLPILLKGILDPDDARKALDYGVDGLLVSNHGGRQVDGAVAAVEQLPKIAAALRGQLPIVLDSGVRGGADTFKALALGATAVGIGRPYCYGLAIAGAAGVAEVLANFQADFQLTMGLAGCREIADISAERLVTA